jgi:hypothetical protein
LVRIVGMAPLSKSWPVRRKLLGLLDPRALEGPIVEIPDAFDWSYFQSAPNDQRIGPLRGDEWIAYKGMHRGSTWFWTRLPGVQAGARVYGPVGSPTRGLPIRLWADTLHIDVDQQSCSVLWRGWFPVAGERDLEAIRVVLGLDVPAHPDVWMAPLGADADGEFHSGGEQFGDAAEPAWPTWLPPRRSSVPPPLPDAPFDALGPEAYANTVLFPVPDSDPKGGGPPLAPAA